MKRRVVFFALPMLVLILIVLVAAIPLFTYIIVSLWNGDVTAKIAESVLFIALFALVIGISGWSLVFYSGHMVIYSDGIKTKLRGNQKYTYVELGEIKEVVIARQPIISKRSGELALRLNSKTGVLLGYGNSALRALMKMYPNIKFRVPYLGLGIFRSNVRMLGKRGCIGKHNAMLYAKLYRLPADFAQKHNSQNTTDY